MVLYPNKLPESERVCSGICIKQFAINNVSELTETDKDALVSQLFEYYKRLVALQVYAQIT